MCTLAPGITLDMPISSKRKLKQAQHRRKRQEKRPPLFRIWSIPKDTVNILLIGFEKTVHFLTGGKFLPPKKRRPKTNKWQSFNYGHSNDSGEHHGMFLALRPSTLQLIYDVNNNAAPNDVSMSAIDTLPVEEQGLPNWLCERLSPSSILDQRTDEDPSWFTLDMKTSCEQLPPFMHIVPDKARQNIGDWLTNDPSLMISIPMIPKLIPGDRLGLIFQYGQLIHLSSCEDDARDSYLGYVLDPHSKELHAVWITFYRLGHGIRDVDILREAGIMQHVNHKHVMPKFHGMAVVEASEQYCQWVTVRDYVDKNISTPVDLSTFINSEIIRRRYFLVSCQRWFDWINMARLLLQNLHLIHLEGIVFGDLDIDDILVHKESMRHVPCIVDFKHACYGDYSTLPLLGGLPREQLAACAHGHEDALLSSNMDPSLAYDAHVTQHHDLFSYGYIIRNIGSCLFVPELENLGVRIMHSRQQDRSEGGALSAECIISELRALTFRAAINRPICGPIDCYELAKQLQKRTPGLGSLFSIYSGTDCDASANC